MPSNLIHNQLISQADRVTSAPPDDSGPLPYAPGQSPFRVKGTVYRGHLEWVAAHVPGGINGMNAAFRDPRLAGYLAQEFLPSSFYDVVPVVASAYVVARACAMPFTEFLRMRSLLQAQRDLGGLHRLLLKLASPAQVVSRYAAVQAQYFDFGSASARLVEPRCVELERRQIPAMLVEWFVPAQEAFLEVALGTAGASEVTIHTRAAEADGELRGAPAARILSRVTWA